jgi:uncharacterized tellurite resistance protein B-like protein
MSGRCRQSTEIPTHYLQVRENMLNAIRAFFEQNLVAGPDASEADAAHAERLAIAALLLEMLHMDGEDRPEQRAVVQAAVRNDFELSDAEAAELLELAEAERSDASDYFQFTSLLNASYSAEQKIALVETLWRIAYADARLHKYEEHLARKVADLLHVPHGAFIAAKMRVAGG